ncbi:NERD domain-containing protein [Streptomyces bambusae]|uniref:nuclease-related domain-containing protein n=1 Tax=Streptomyces bambusae TaxID=1550616 RepID=UPI001CFDC885|nr:nuclease-related domain-containing protein [Streptomyces bambusae]MCB5165137.1 NERD domain-containing protein [Streptomyces bambusae]
MESWRKGLEGERKVGKELRRFLGHGWQVLHSVPLPPKHDIDHLLIGPGGVFTLNTKNFRGRSVWVGDDVIKVDHGPGYPIPRKARRESERAAKVLSAHCGFSVAVNPLLVFVQPAAVELASPQQKVRVYDERTLAALAHVNGVLDARQVEQIYAVARHRQAWKGA